MADTLSQQFHPISTAAAISAASIPAFAAAGGSLAAQTTSGPAPGTLAAQAASVQSSAVLAAPAPLLLAAERPAAPAFCGSANGASAAAFSSPSSQIFAGQADVLSMQLAPQTAGCFSGCSGFSSAAAAVLPSGLSTPAQSMAQHRYETTPVMLNQRILGCILPSENVFCYVAQISDVAR